MLGSLALDAVGPNRTVTGLDFSNSATRHIATGACRDMVDFDAVVERCLTVAR